MCSVCSSVLVYGVYTVYGNFIEQIYSMEQLIKVPTRVTATTSTTLDLILTTVPSKHFKSGVIKSGISDHFFYIYGDDWK